MFKIGIDVGSTYTKYCVMENDIIIDLFLEKTPIKQKEYFDKKICELKRKYNNPSIVSCGYGRKNIDSIKQINELTALSKGANYLFGSPSVVLDIGGQDTKIITQENGTLKDFFLNDRCAAGSGMFLQNTCSLLDYSFTSIDLTDKKEPSTKISSVCAVFAQSEITELLADNVDEETIIDAVIWHTLSKAKVLVDKVNPNNIIISGGFSQIKGIDTFSSIVLACNCITDKKNVFLSAIGCCL